MHENQVRIGTVDFYGNELITVLYESVEYVAMKPIVEGMGLSWQGQQNKIKMSRGYQAVLIPLQTNGGSQEMLCMPLSKLNGWLFSICPEKVRPEIRPMVELYQEESFIVLYDYWHAGAVINPRTENRYQISVVQILSEAQAAVELHKMLTREDEQTKLFICNIIKEIYGIDCLDLSGIASIEEARPAYGKKTRSARNAKEVYLTPTQLGRRMGVSPHKANRLLREHGLIESYRNKQNHVRWRPTEKGMPYVMPEYIRKKPDGSRRQCLMFLESVIEIIHPIKGIKD